MVSIFIFNKKPKSYQFHKHNKKQKRQLISSTNFFFLVIIPVSYIFIPFKDTISQVSDFLLSNGVWFSLTNLYS